MTAVLAFPPTVGLAPGDAALYRPRPAGALCYLVEIVGRDLDRRPGWWRVRLPRERDVPALMACHEDFLTKIVRAV